ncbi:MAG TPA: DUF4238 domain-containing protein [Allosphingosinicella sp.]|jgi:hypothetical protein|nr:DUF4238 domain-containing protein [Allosphingosinicella sp.]
MAITAKPTPRTKNQHFVPRLHLQHFRGEQPKNMIWTYDAEKGTARPSRIEETGAQTNFYSIKRDDGSYLDTLEKWLEGVETAADEPYRALLRGDIPKGQAKADFAVFVASLFARSPSLIRAQAEGYAQALQMEMDVHWGTRERFDRFIDRFEADTGEHVRDRDHLFAFWHDKKRFFMEISQKRGLSIIGATDKITDFLYERNWYLLDASESFYVTGDSPVFRYVDPDATHPIYGDGGFKNPASEVTLPLSPLRLLMITGHSVRERHFTLGPEAVWGLNAARAYQAERFLYSHVKDERVSELAAKHKDDRQRFQIGWSKGFAEVKLTR